MSAAAPRAALVTGAAKGIGLAIAGALHAAGLRVALADLDVTVAEQAAAQLGDGATAIELDVASRTSFAAGYAAAEERLGPVDVLVNNAALTVPRSFWEIEADEWDRVLAVNLRSVLFGCQIAGERLRERAWGRIVNLSSLAGQQGGLVAGAHYAASKAGILVLTKIVAAELAPHGTTVNAVVPAAIRGPAMDAMDPERLAAVRQTVPVRRFGEPREVAALVAFLCGEDAGYVTGAALDVNGGLAMR